MEIIDLDKAEKSYSETGIALGNFDGIHKGHQEIIKSMVEESKKRNLKPALLLFKNHTKKTIMNKKPAMLTSNNQKIKLAEDLGVEVVFLLEFTKDVMSLKEEEFIDQILQDSIKARYLVVGFDYRFGFKAKGTADSLKELGAIRNMDVKIINPIDVKGEVISSTVIRDAIEAGDMAKVKKLLGRNFRLEGRVVDGKKRGTLLGFPTANLSVDPDYVLPKNGVYETSTSIDNKVYKSITNIGYNPTFENDEIKIETFIMDFSDNIYNREIEVEFIDYLREDIKFDTKEELIEQIKKDVDSIL